MHEFTLFFLFMLASSLALRWWLSQRQLDSIAAHRHAVPDAFADSIALADHQKAADYTTARTRFGRIPMIYDALLLLAWTLGGGLEVLDGLTRSLALDPIVTDHLGDVYWAVGRDLEADFQWRRALSFEPEEELAERIRRKLEVGLDQVLIEEGADPIRIADGDG